MLCGVNEKAKEGNIQKFGKQQIALCQHWRSKMCRDINELSCVIFLENFTILDAGTEKRSWVDPMLSFSQE